MIIYDRGIRVLDSSLWLDAHRRAEVGYISHAHADHIRRHDKVLGTPATIRFFEQRYKKRTETIVLPYNKPFELENIKIELFPSGHMLGASQIMVIKDDMRLVYTGDFNMYTSETAEKIEIREADILIMEATFGLPHFKFPPRWQVIKQLMDFIDDCFDHGLIPVIMAYALGKSQEVVKILGDRGYEISVYKTIADMTTIYKDLGVAMSNWQPFQGEDLHRRVMIVPPRLTKWIKGLYPGIVRTAMVTGWAIDKQMKYRFGADSVIAMSDHSDFDGLLKYVRKVSPQKIFVTHGYNEFVHALKQDGFNASPLVSEPQLSLF
ncbi:hypothetical protein JW960_29200 [candidate division KSB1 bacterium]|nr:hypothetical protein [candidate division KSB1 bacterium]